MEFSLGRPEWDNTDYREFQWLGQPRGAFPIMEFPKRFEGGADFALPPIETRLRMLGIRINDGYFAADFDPFRADDFARQIRRGPWDRVVHRRDQAQAERERQEQMQQFWQAIERAYREGLN